MKYLLQAGLFVFVSISSFSQLLKDKTDSCSCRASAYLKVPSNNSEVYGTVIVEFEVDTNCLCANPVIIKSVSKELDEASLQTMQNLILQLNKCRSQCLFTRCAIKKLKQPISFLPPQDD